MASMDLIPAPVGAKDLRAGDGFAVDERTVIDAGPGTEGAARWLRQVIGAATGLPLGPGADGSDRTVRLRIDAGVADTLGPEGYRLDVDSAGIGLHGGSAAGVFWGAQTLRQLLGPEAFRRAPLRQDRQWTVPGCAIEDGPRFAWRGMMLDVGRHFMPKAGVLRYLDLLAAHKLNVFHFHLTDDQGWRIEIKRHPRLTEVGAWRSRTKWGHRASPLWDEKPHGGFYTQDDIREIVAYAAERHITVVPEIDIPGHSQAAISAYPELGNTDVVDTAALTVWDTWGVSPHVLAPTEKVLRFYEGVLDEVLALFPSTFIHLGGDECPKDQWQKSPAAQARMAELGLADEDELQSWFIRHFDRWLAERGRRLIGWDEILEGGLAPGAAVSSWRGYAGGIAAAESGHDVVMCPEQQVYLDHRQHGGEDEPMPIGYVRTLEDVYRFEPVPPQLAPEAAAHVIGTQANVWTEVMEDQNRVDYQAFPRLVAFSEVAWSALPAPAERDYPDFDRRMAVHYARLDALGVHYRPPGGPLPAQRRPAPEGLTAADLGRPIEGTPPNV
ncbi:beta-N-acetylhexosaminidase [Streptomyces sp. NBC_01500]|uniref:beta-N-acetylhexosaminidase n=1 Tax=Streptomyces sp. NBC_01500 TaxID=2903886 RepID=UPI00224FA233|nr:beta-N-acetylhexosaminidase [Streptomyces sp. NBC_01500]MCX4550787.1 beta-N-acetylhexosaminidase [Streptomyces sp. NBC_01500]